jgi:hypothetical protein
MRATIASQRPSHSTLLLVPRPSPCLVLEDHAIEQAAHHLLFVLVEARDGLELQAQIVAGAANSTDYVFDYDSSLTTPSPGNLTEVVLPYKGALVWAYGNITYIGSRVQQEVGARYLSKDGSRYTEYPLYHESGTSSLTIHGCTVIDDPGGLGEKYWAFSASGANQGLATYYQGRSPVGGSNCSSTPGSHGHDPECFHLDTGFCKQQLHRSGLYHRRSRHEQRH